MAIREGRQAPHFTLEDSNGARVALSDFAGKHVVLYFYPRDNTPGCTAEAQGFRDLFGKLQQRGVVVLGVSPDSTASHAEFTACHRLPFPLLSDPDREVMTAYGAYGDKMVNGKQTRGVIRSTVWIGSDGRVVKHWAEVTSAAGHPTEVLAAMDGV